MRININPEDLATVSAILQRIVPNHEVHAFGSRVKDTATEFSDLDLVVITQQPLSLATYTELCEAFSNSDLPFRVDILDWSVLSDHFKELISTQFLVIHQKHN